jgi:subtilisin-like proprotein convertase family protein
MRSLKASLIHFFNNLSLFTVFGRVFILSALVFSLILQTLTPSRHDQEVLGSASSFLTYNHSLVQNFTGNNGNSPFLDFAIYDGNIYVVGSCYPESTMDFDPTAGVDNKTCPTTANAGRLFVSSYTSAGAYRWTVTINNPGPGTFVGWSRITVDANGVYVGFTKQETVIASGGTPQYHARGNVLRKYTHAGALVWTREIDFDVDTSTDNSWDVGLVHCGVEVDAAGNIYLCTWGDTLNRPTFDNPDAHYRVDYDPTGGTDYQELSYEKILTGGITKLDTNGNYIWTRSWQMDNTDSGDIYMGCGFYANTGVDSAGNIYYFCDYRVDNTYPVIFNSGGTAAAGTRPQIVINGSTGAVTIKTKSEFLLPTSNVPFVTFDSSNNVYLYTVVSGASGGTVMDLDSTTGVDNGTVRGDDILVAKYTSGFGSYLGKLPLIGLVGNQDVNNVYVNDTNAFVAGYSASTADFHPGEHIPDNVAGTFLANYLHGDFSLVWSVPLIPAISVSSQTSYMWHNVILDSVNDIYLWGWIDNNVDLDPTAGTANYGTNTLDPKRYYYTKLTNLIAPGATVVYTPTPSPTPTPTPVPTTPFPSTPITPTPLPSGMSCTSYTEDTDVAISNTGTTTVTSTVNVPVDYVITDVNIKDIKVYHTYVSDLNFSIQSPATTNLQVIASACGSENNLYLTLDDEAANDATTWPCPPVDGLAYKPEVLLSGFDGQSTLGAWTLTVDDTANGDGGYIDSWTLEVCYDTPVAPTSTPTLIIENTSTPTPSTTLEVDPPNVITPTATNKPDPTTEPTPQETLPVDATFIPSSTLPVGVTVFPSIPTGGTILTTGTLDNTQNPEIVYFYPNDFVIDPDQGSIVYWKVVNVDTVDIVGIAENVPHEGAITLPPETLSVTIIGKRGDKQVTSNILLWKQIFASEEVGTSLVAAFIFTELIVPVLGSSTKGNILFAAIPLIERIRKRLPWGIVYDSTTKRLLGRAIVRLYDVKSGKLISTSVTDALGVFKITPKKGTYRIVVTKVGYLFPSSVIVGDHDGQYKNIYHGETVTLVEDGKPLTLTIPLDRKDEKENKNKRTLRAIQSRLLFIFEQINSFLLYAGFAYSLVAMFRVPSLFNGVVLVFYAAFFGLKLYFESIPEFGTVSKGLFTTVKGIEVGLYEPEFNTLVARTFTDKDGKYAFYVENKDYYLQLIDKNFTIVSAKAKEGKLFVKRNKEEGIKIIKENLLVKDLNEPKKRKAPAR